MKHKSFPARLQTLREVLTAKDVFFAALATRMPWEVGPVPTAATDGARIIFGESWCGGLTDEELLGVIRHEVLHVVNHDHLYRNGKDAKRWNMATDHRINLILADAGVKLPAGALKNPEYAGLTGEEIYRLLKDGDGDGGRGNKPGGDGGQGDGEADGGDTFEGDIGGVLDAPGRNGKAELDENQKAQESAEIDSKVFQAAQAAKMCGQGSAIGERLVGKLRRGRIDWRAELASLFYDVCRDDYSWSRPNRSFLWQGIYLPSLGVPAPPSIAVVVDTSGSIGAEEITAFISEIESLISATGASVTCISADAEIVGEPVTVGRADLPLTWVPQGGGGTDFRPACAWVAEHPEVVGLVYLTDGCGPFPSAVEVPSIWLMTSDVVSPVGRTVRIEV